MFVKALVDSGATRMFIDLKFVWSENIWTHQLPRAILVYNVDGTPNEAGHITEVIDLIVQYKDHSEQATFHIMGIGHTTIILEHTWLMEHSPEIAWCTGDVNMTRCLTSCTPNDWLNQTSDETPKQCSNVHLHH